MNKKLLIILIPLLACPAPIEEKETEGIPVCGNREIEFSEECDGGENCNTYCRKNKIVFVTEKLYSIEEIQGKLGANTICTNEGKVSIFEAWLFDGSSSEPKEFDYKNSYYLITGELIADTWEDLLDGSLYNPINKDIYGNLIDSKVWTGIAKDGSGFYENTCDGWNKSLQEYAIHGETMSTNENWTDKKANELLCGSKARLYCFEK